jgi:hypothetical protein
MACAAGVHVALRGVELGVTGQLPHRFEVGAAAHQRGQEVPRSASFSTSASRGQSGIARSCPDFGATESFSDSARRTVTTPSFKSTSRTSSALTSPCRRPANAASAIATRSHPSAFPSIASTSAVDGALGSFRTSSLPQDLGRHDLRWQRGPGRCDKGIDR